MLIINSHIFVYLYFTKKNLKHPVKKTRRQALGVIILALYLAAAVFKFDRHRFMTGQAIPCRASGRGFGFCLS
jgi:hypothetical protein